MLRWGPVLWVLVEVAGFAVAGRLLGVLGTLALLLVGTVAGLALLRQGGRATLSALTGRRPTPFGAGPGLGAKGDPRRLLREGGFGVAAGLLLVIPGFASDIAAMALLLPPVQRGLLRRLGATGRQGLKSGPPQDRAPEHVIIDADWIEVSPAPGPTASPNGSSGWTRPD